LPPAPILEPLAPELLAFVGDQVLGGRVRPTRGTAQEATDISIIGNLPEDGEAHDATRKVVEVDGNPVGKGLLMSAKAPPPPRHWSSISQQNVTRLFDYTSFRFALFTVPWSAARRRVGCSRVEIGGLNFFDRPAY
jgi:hypothetical protein